MPAPPDVDLFGRRPRSRADWSHRRGEPRGLALAWTVYLMLVTLGSLAPAVSTGRFEPDVYRPAARILMCLVMVGLCVLWPMLRLTQSPGAESPARFVARDLAVLLLPALTLVWPQLLLADWSAGVVGALSALMIVWAAVVGVVMHQWRVLSRDGWLGRVLAMGVVVLWVLGGPLVFWQTGLLSVQKPGEFVTPGWMWTPVTSAWEVLRDRGWSGRPARVYVGHWSWIISLAGLACAAWIASIWSARLVRPMLSDRHAAGEH